MPENTVALQIPTAPVVSIFRMVDDRAQAAPDAMALGPHCYADLKDACLRLRTADDLAYVDPSDPLHAIPATLGNLTNGSVHFAKGSAHKHRKSGEFLFPVHDGDTGPEAMRLPQHRLVKIARALARRYRFSATDRIHVDGALDDPGSWLALTAAFCAGAPVVLSPEDATIVWSLANPAPEIPETARLVHLRTEPETLSEMQRRHPAITWVNGLSLAQGGGLPVCSDPRDPPETVTATLGRPLGDTEVMIVDPETGLDRLLYETGEVWLRRGGTIVGYTNGRSALAEADFLPTGIMGYLDSEGRLVPGAAPEDET